MVRPRFDPSMARKLLGLLGDIHLVAIQPDGPTKGRYFGADVDSALKWASIWNDKEWNVYWTVNHVQPGTYKKPGKAQITAARGAHCDIDPPTDGTPWDKGATIEVLGWHVAPSLIIDSGNGVQPVWLMGTPEPDLLAVELINGALRDGWRGDNCQNIDRLLRLPGSVNYPNKSKLARGYVPCMASWAQEDSGRRYTLTELQNAFPAQENREVNRQPANGPGDNFVYLGDGELIAAMQRGESWHDNMLRLTGRLVERGRTDAEILELAESLTLKGFRVDETLRDMCRMISGARRKGFDKPKCGPGDFQDESESAPKSDPGIAFRNGVSAAALMAMEFNPVRFVVNRYVVEGVTLLAGSPKIGKSWFALDLALSVANGLPAMLTVPCDEGDVLYLALEDTQRRLKHRLKKMDVANPPERLRLISMNDGWPDLDNGCLDEMKKWIDRVEKPTLIIVDVLNKIRGKINTKEDAYAADYRAITGLQQLAADQAIAIVVVHHTRKMDAGDDPFDGVSGTRGLTGAADSTLILKREAAAQRVTLYGRGRDISEIETAMEFDKDNCRWKVLGAAYEVAKTAERQELLDLLRSAGKALKVSDIAKAAGKKVANVSKMLSKMADEGLVSSPQFGFYISVEVVEVSDLDCSTSPTSTTFTNIDIKENPFRTPLNGDARPWRSNGQRSKSVEVTEVSNPFVDNPSQNSG